MTTDNETRVQQSLKAMERGDLDWIAAQAHPGVEFVNPPYALEPGTRHGIEGFKTGLGGMLDAFDELRFESGRVIDLGDRIVAVGLWSGTGRGSRYEFAPQPYAFVVTLSEGLVTRYEWFADADEAMRAAGVDPAGG